MNIKNILSPLPIRKSKPLGELSFAQKMRDTYHFFAGYMGTLERIAIVRNYKTNDLVIGNEATYKAEINKVSDKMHMGVFDYLTFGLFFLSTRLVIKPELGYYKPKRNANHKGHYYVAVTDLGGSVYSGDGTFYKPLFVLLSGLAALPRIIFGSVFMVLATPFVAVVHFISVLANWSKKPGGYTGLQSEAGPLAKESDADDSPGHDQAVSAHVSDQSSVGDSSFYDDSDLPVTGVSTAALPVPEASTAALPVTGVSRATLPVTGTSTATLPVTGISTANLFVTSSSSPSLHTLMPSADQPQKSPAEAAGEENPYSYEIPVAQSCFEIQG